MLLPLLNPVLEPGSSHPQLLIPPPTAHPIPNFPRGSLSRYLIFLIPLALSQSGCASFLQVKQRDKLLVRAERKITELATAAAAGGGGEGGGRSQRHSGATPTAGLPVISNSSAAAAVDAYVVKDQLEAAQREVKRGALEAAELTQRLGRVQVRLHKHASSDMISISSST